MTNKVDIKIVHSGGGYKASAKWDEVEVSVEAAGIEPEVLLHETIVLLRDAVAWEKNYE